METFNERNLSGKPIDHLGLVSDVINELGLIEKIDARLPLPAGCGSKVSMGERVSAMILNGLGFVDSRLYMFPEFLRNKPMDRLFGKDLKAEWFNDDAIGRCLDATFEYGTSQLFAEISLEIGTEKNLLGRSANFDTSTLQLYGEYPGCKVPEEEAGKTCAPIPARGYSKSKRHDLNQMVLNLATTGKANFPVWMEAHHGNASDQKILPAAAQRMQGLCNQLAETPEFLYVGDSAIYANILPCSDTMMWLTRVPEKILQAKQLVGKEDDLLSWQPLDEGYAYHKAESNYGGVKQRWFLIFSEQAYEREIKTLARNIEKEYEKLKKGLWHLSKEVFSCPNDAVKASKEFKKKIKYHQAHCDIQPILGHTSQGRPKKKTTETVKGYQITYRLSEDNEKIAQAKLKKGRFILSTNEFDQKKLPDTAVLSEYKKQSGTESGFKFIKDNTFEVDSVFLKKPSRIDALMMVMTLCLMVYGYTQYTLKEALQKNNETVPNQKRKPTNNPSLKWIYFLFSGVQELTISTEGYNKNLVINLDKTLTQIIGYFGPRAQEIYLNSS